MYVCMYAIRRISRRADRNSAHRSRFGAPIAIRHADCDSAHIMDFLKSGLHLGGTDVSQIEYAFILYMYVWIYTIFAIGTLFRTLIAIRRDDRRAGWYRCVSKLQVEYACIMNVCIYRRAGSTVSTIYVYMHALFSEILGAPIAIRRAVRYSACRLARWVALMCLKLNVYVL